MVGYFVCSLPLVDDNVLKQAPLVNFIPFSDAGGVQVRPHPEESSEGEAGHDAALRSQAAQDPDQVPGPPVEEEQHEDHVGHLPEGPPQAQ